MKRALRNFLDFFCDPVFTGLVVAAFLAWLFAR